MVARAAVAGPRPPVARERHTDVDDAAVEVPERAGESPRDQAPVQGHTVAGHALTLSSDA
jgi:hypothetical protein